MNVYIKTKQFALAYIPGAVILRDMHNFIKPLLGLHKRLYEVEQILLVPLTAKLLKTLAPYVSPSIPLIRVGKKGDGGYIMGDIFDKVDAAYSFGIAGDVSWDKDIANRSIPVFMYDHTINNLPEKHKNFHFFKTGICGKPNFKGMKDIGTLIKQNGHLGKNLVMKMDIEGSEYPAIQALTDNEVAHFTQIAMEVHDLQHLLFDAEKHRIISECFGKILKYMYCVHIHINNNGKVEECNGIRVPAVLELSFIRKDMATDFKRTKKLRTDLDEPNIPKNKEIDVHFLWDQKYGI